LNRPVNFFGAVMKIGVGEIVPAGIIAITIAASKDVSGFRIVLISGLPSNSTKTSLSDI